MAATQHIQQAQHAAATRVGNITKPACWNQYWQDSEFQATDRRAILIQELLNYFQSPAGRPLLSSLKPKQWFEKTVVALDWRQLMRCGSADLPQAIQHAPEEALACIAAAIHETLFISATSPASHPLQLQLDRETASSTKVIIRLQNHPSLLPISAVRADQVSRLVTIRGTIIRATPIKPMVTSLQFTCAKCGCMKDVDFPEGRYVQPTSCGEDGCRSRTLNPVRSSAICVDWQRIQVQGLPRDEKGGQGRVPTPIDVELLQDLAGCCAPGDVVTITGLVKVLAGEPASGKRFGDAKRQCLYLPYIEAISVAPVGKEHSPQGANDANMNDTSTTVLVEPDGPSYLPPNMPGFTQKDLDFIRKFTQVCEGDQLRQFVKSLAPTICGMDIVKCGLLLALFGGVPKGSPGSVPLRGDIHVLLVGDPGIGKSQLLQAAAAAAPRGVYVCGSSSSSAGLTVSIARENGEFFFDAGALVLADRGVCCVDEFDKASGEHAALLGAMEQQEVAVAKAGLVASLPARTTVLAAANPAEGQYNRGKTLMQNLKMSPAMLSRFDLIFLLLDRPDAEKDERLTRHVLAAHADLRAAAATRGGLGHRNPFAPTPAGPLGAQGPPHNYQQQQHDPVSRTHSGTRPALVDRLKTQRPDDEPLPVQLLRKYIAYARQYCHPRLSDEAREVLKTFFLHLRGQSAADSSAPPVTHRQLESLVRLAEARARIDLRETITLEDAEDVIEVMKETLDGMLADGPGLLDFGLGGGGGGRSGKGVQAERRRFMEAVQRICQNKNDTALDVSELYDIADRIELAVPDTAAFLEHLNETGDLLKKGPGKFQYNGSIRSAANRGGHPTQNY